MRPRKSVIIWSACDEQAGDLAFLLNMRLRLAAFARGEEIIGALWVTAADLVILFEDGRNIRRVAEWVATIAPLCPVLVLDPKERRSIIHTATRSLWGKVKPEDMLETVRVMLARKRGPKKGAQRASPPVSFCSLSA